MQTQSLLKQTPLFKEHLKLDARMVGFGGWEMPLFYEGILAEYENTRRAVSLFDTSHMGEFLIKGDYKKSGLDYLLTCSLNGMPLKACRYGVTLNKVGGVIDDLIVFRKSDQEWMIVVNGATTEKDQNHFVRHLTAEAHFDNISQKTGKIDVQGPLAREILKDIIPGIEKLDYYSFDVFQVLGENSIVSRTGYTGELGYEIYFPWNKIKELWKKLLHDDKVKPAGLGARDLLRLEMGYSLYGQDLDEATSPLEAGLSKFTDFDKDFLGRNALIKQKEEGIKRRMIFFNCESRRSPRHNHKIYALDHQEIGIVTSGGFSPALKKGIGMGLVTTNFMHTEKTILIGDNHKNTFEAQIASRPFYKKGTFKN